MNTHKKGVSQMIEKIQKIHDETLASLIVVEPDWTKGEVKIRAGTSRKVPRYSFSLCLSGDKALTIERVGGNVSIGFGVCDLYPPELMIIAEAATRLQGVKS